MESGLSALEIKFNMVAVRFNSREAELPKSNFSNRPEHGPLPSEKIYLNFICSSKGMGDSI